MTPALRVAAAACAALAGMLAVVVHPALFLGGGGGWIAFDAWYASGQWWSARLAVAALALFAAAAWAEPSLVSGGARPLWLAPAAAAAVLVHFVVVALPHPDTVSRWHAGELGIAAWRRAERARAHPAAVASSADAFAGAWRAADGTAYRFHADRVEWTGPGGAGTLSRATCGDPWDLAYEAVRGDMVLAMNVAWTPGERGRLAALGPEVRLAVAAAWCARAGSPVFVRVAADAVWLKRAGDEAARPATVLARQRAAPSSSR